MNNIENEIKHNSQFISCLINNNNLSEAKVCIDEFRKLYGENCEVYSLEGCIRIIENDLVEAESSFSKGLEIEPTNCDLNYNMAYVCEQNNKIKEALEYYSIAKRNCDDPLLRRDIDNIIENLKMSFKREVCKDVIGEELKLHIGCGRTHLDGWINVDLIEQEGVDLVFNLEECKIKQLPLKDNSVKEFYASHVLEHINNTLDLMEELHRVAAPNAKATFRVPYGSSDEAFEDPTHVKQYYLNSFGYFSQPFYWRADYGYRGDWVAEKVTLVVNEKENKGKTPQEILNDVMKYRNIVVEMIVELRAIKPIRDPKKELQVMPKIEFNLV